MTSDQPTTAATVDRDAVRRAVRHGGIVDITTHGRRSGQARRIEIVSFVFDGRVYISGLPGPRGWYANLTDDPRLTYHVKGGVEADLPATATLITDEPTRRAILSRVTRVWKREAQLERFVADSPLIEVTFDDATLLDD